MWKTCGIRICMTDVKAIRALLINEVVPDDPRQDFHGSDTGAYAGSLISLFQKAGIGFRSMKDIDESGITVINAVNTPKQGRKITSLQMEESMPAFRKTVKAEGSGSCCAEWRYREEDVQPDRKIRNRQKPHPIHSYL